MQIIYIIVAISIVLFLLLAFTIYSILFKRKYTSILCNKTQFKKDFNAFVSNTKLPLSKTGSKYSYTMWLRFENVAENSEWF